ncbi:MAG: response regulator transcription factor [Rubrivivax sp.]|nr:response regulator transcription factor [Rubrivivax sp.]
MPTVLLIDDDEQLGPPLAAYLQRFDFRLECATTPSAGLARLAAGGGGAAGGIDAVILDVMLPEMDGFEVCRRIRATSSVPVLMLTARGELSDRVVGLELGADDYLPKPFEPRELAARLQTILRRARAAPGDGVLRFPGLEVDPVRREARQVAEGGGAAVALPLTGTEFELLLLLAREPQKVFSRDEILNRLRGQDAELFSRAVDILVSRLRRKLEPLDCIRTLRNAGYAFALPRLP